MDTLAYIRSESCHPRCVELYKEFCMGVEKSMAAFTLRCLGGFVGAQSALNIRNAVSITETKYRYQLVLHYEVYKNK